VLVLAGIAVGGVYVTPLKPALLRRLAPPESVRVTDATGTVSLAVPTAWAGQLQASGWNPAAIRLPAGQAPGLAVAPELDRWRDPARHVPGVFAGLTPALGSPAAKPALPSHAVCTKVADRRYESGEMSGRIQRWVRCAGTSISFSEVLLVHTGGDYGLYVQIKQIDQTDQPDRTDDILDGLRVRKP